MSSHESQIQEFEEMADAGRYAEILEKLRLLSRFDQLSKIYWSLYAYENLGQIKEGVEYYKIHERVIQNHDRESLKTKIYNTVGSLYYKSGKPLRAYEFFQRAFENAIRLQQRQDITEALNNLGTVNVSQGNLDKALEFYEKCYQNALKANNISVQGNTLYNIGTIHFLRDNLEQAKEKYQASLKLRRKIGNLTRIAQSLMKLIEVEFEETQPDFEVIDTYYKELREIANEKNTDQITLYYLATKAIRYKWQEDYEKAEMLHRDIISDNQDIEITITSILQLIQILIAEYQNEGKQSILNEIHSLLDKMFEISKEQYSFRYLIKSLILKSQISAIEGDFDDAYMLIERALQSTKDHNMEYLRNEIINLRDRLTSEYETLKDLFEDDSSVINRIESSSIMEFLKDTGNI